jgi:hypothetical protein
VVPERRSGFAVTLHGAVMLAGIVAAMVAGIAVSIWLGILLLFAASCLRLILKPQRDWSDWLLPAVILASGALEFGDVADPIWGLLLIIAFEVVVVVLHRRGTSDTP